MKFADYIPLAMRTCKELPHEEHLAHMAMGITGEMGEIIDALKKHHIYGKELDQANLVEELGDCCWYLAGLLQSVPEMCSKIKEYSLLSESVLARRRPLTVRNILMTNATVAKAAAKLVCPINPYIYWDAVQTMLEALLDTAQLLDIDLEQALDINIAKLAKRYGDKYSDYSAINRDLDAERAILEGKA